jgi:hypothetical protein
MTNMVQQLDQTVFKDALKGRFIIRPGDMPEVEAELIDVTDLGSTPNHEQFSVIFRCRSAGVLPQRIYTIEREGLGSFDIFLVPIRRDAEGIYYEAIFNRPRRNDSALTSDDE